MLILSRRDGEAIRIGRDNESIARGEFLEITIYKGTRPHQPKIGIEAAQDVKILRAEVFARWCEENEIIPASEPTRSIFAERVS